MSDCICGLCGSTGARSPREPTHSERVSTSAGLGWTLGLSALLLLAGCPGDAGTIGPVRSDSSAPPLTPPSATVGLFPSPPAHEPTVVALVPADRLPENLHLRTPPPVSGRNAAVDHEILPADVLARVKLLRAELELIRTEMGCRESLQRELDLSNAAPREVFFQALSLQRKTDRLCAEHTFASSAAASSPPPVAAIRPAHVWRVVDAALQQLLRVKAHLGIPEHVAEEPQALGTSPSEVLGSIIQANRQVNLLLERRFSPSDVFQQVTQATNYAARLLETFPGASRRPAPLPFVRKKTPVDVYERLLRTHTTLVALGNASGVQMVELGSSEATLPLATPSDVYDLASLILSELAYFHGRTGAPPPVKASYPGKRLPSHVYQRVGMLEAQIEELRRRIVQEPDWLERKHGG